MTRNVAIPVTLAAALLALAACAAPARTSRSDRAETSPSCEELAKQRATEQYDSDSESADQRLGGSIQDSALRQQLRAMDAAARRREVYEQCVKLRGQPAAPAEGTNSDK